MLHNAVGHYLTINNSRYSYFAGNDYLGLANHPTMVEEAMRALMKYGVSVSASRKTTGTSAVHLELEKSLANFKGQQEAVVFGTGYLGNRLLLDALKNDYTMVLADAMAHPSILDGIPKEIPFRFYNHCNTRHLETFLRENQKYRALIITDGVFALTGEMAPLDEIYLLAQKYNALLVIDDAHATGVLGKNGRGTPEHFNLHGAANLYQSETMSKALGAYGGFVSSGSEIIGKIRSESSFYGASTALPPSIAVAGCTSVKLIKQHPEWRQKLHENALLIREGVRELGFSTTDSITPIIPVFFHEKQKSKDLSDFMKKNQIITPSIDYPVKMNYFIVRITVSANHTKKQIDDLLSLLKEWRDKHGVD